MDFSCFEKPMLLDPLDVKLVVQFVVRPVLTLCAVKFSSNLIYVAIRSYEDSGCLLQLHLVLHSMVFDCHVA